MLAQLAGDCRRCAGLATPPTDNVGGAWSALWGCLWIYAAKQAEDTLPLPTKGRRRMHRITKPP